VVITSLHGTTTVQAVTPSGWHFHCRCNLHFYPGEGEVAADDAAAVWWWWWLASPSDSACTMRGSALLPSRNSSSVRRSSWFLSIWSKILSTRFCGVLSSSDVGCCPCKKQVRICMHSKRNAEVPSCGKTLSFTYSQCVCSLSYPACNAHAPYYIFILGLSDSWRTFLHYLIKNTIFRKNDRIQNVCFDSLYNISFWNISRVQTQDIPACSSVP